MFSVATKPKAIDKKLAEKIKNLFTAKDYAPAKLELHDLEKMNFTSTSINSLYYEIIKIIIQKQNKLEVLTQLIKEKGYPPRFMGFIHREIIVNARYFHDKHDHLENGLTENKLEIHYNLANNYHPEIKFSYRLLSFLAALFYNAENYKKALVYFNKCHAMSMKEDKIYSAVDMGDCYHKLNQIDKAYERFSLCVKLFKELDKKSQFEHDLRVEVASAAHYCATYLDSGSDPQFTQALKYYKFAIDLHSTESMHTLAKKYQFGQDVDVDVNLAIDYYEKAALKGHRDSVISLFRLLHRLKRDCCAVVKIMLTIKNDKLIYNLLAMYYSTLAKSLASTELNQDNEFFSDYHRLAHENYQAAAALGMPAAYFNLGVIFDLGNGVKVNPPLAEKYYNEAAKFGFKKAYINLTAFYQRKLKHSRDNSAHETELNTVSQAMLTNLEKTNSTVKIDKSKGLDALLQQLSEIKCEVKEQCFAINDEIISIVRDSSLKIQAKITAILAHETESIDIINAITMLHKIGGLNEKLRDASIFQHLPKVISLIHLIKCHRSLKPLSPMQVTNLIEGISKLYLQSEAEFIYKFINELLTDVMAQLDNYDLRQKVNILFALTRFDVDALAIQQNAKEIINSIMHTNTVFNLQDYVNFFYAAALLHCRAANLIPDAFLAFLTTHLSKISIGLSPADKFCVQQMYMSLFYFVKKFPNLNSNLTVQLLQAWQEYLNALQEDTRESLLQREIVSFYSPYFVSIENEKRINTLPVDSYISNESQSFILQVDGPSHFLHAEEQAPKPSLKVDFRDAFLRFSAPLICINYFEWHKLKDKSLTEKLDFLQAKLHAININFTPQKWSLVLKSRVGGQFFSANDGASRTRSHSADYAAARITKGM